MSTSFSAEIRSWREVFRLRFRTMIFFIGALALLISLLLMTVWGYRNLMEQQERFRSQVEVMVELQDFVGPEQRNELIQAIEALPMVQQVDYWSPERSLGYIDQHLLSGYQAFLQKNQLELPLAPLFRIRMTDISQKSALLDLLQERYSALLNEVQQPERSGVSSLAQPFLETLSQSVTFLQVALLLLFFLTLAVAGYHAAFLLSERSHGFHLGQMLHWAPPYTFWPALLVVMGWSVLEVSFALLLVYVVLGIWLWLLAGLVLGALVLENIILVWFGRFLVVKWGMR